MGHFWTGFRTLLLFFCGLTVILYRVAHYHAGLHTTPSAFQTVLRTEFAVSTARAIATYVFSAVYFVQIYLNSCADAGLGWLVYFSESRARLNEKPLFIMAHFIVLGIVQAVLHVATDTDRIPLGCVEAREDSGNGAKKTMPTPTPTTPFQQLVNQLPAMVTTSLNRSAASLAVSLVVYPLFVRGALWRTTVGLLRPFYPLPKTSMLPITWPYTFGTLFRCLFSGFMVLFMWTVVNFACSVFLAREPVKHNRPLTSECKDPNRSLLNGLKSKKLHVQCFAMWELALIARDSEARRKAIFEDMDGKDGPMWSQIYAVCRDVIKRMDVRIEEYIMPSPAPAPDPAPMSLAKVEKKNKKTTAPLNKGNILVATPPKQGMRNELEKSLELFAQSPGHDSPLSPMAKAAAAAARERLMKLHRDATGTADPRDFWRQAARQVLESRAGAPLRRAWARRAAAAVLGSPCGEPSLCPNAAFALTTLAARSLSEDRYGNVQRDVADMVRLFTSSVRRLDAFVANLPPHWTDVEADRCAPDVERVRAALRTGLEVLLDGFGSYARDLRLNAREMREAREAVSAGMEVVALEGT